MLTRSRCHTRAQPRNSGQVRVSSPNLGCGNRQLTIAIVAQLTSLLIRSRLPSRSRSSSSHPYGGSPSSRPNSATTASTSLTYRWTRVSGRRRTLQRSASLLRPRYFPLSPSGSPSASDEPTDIAQVSSSPAQSRGGRLSDGNRLLQGVRHALRWRLCWIGHDPGKFRLLQSARPAPGWRLRWMGRPGKFRACIERLPRNSQHGWANPGTHRASGAGPGFVAMAQDDHDLPEAGTPDCFAAGARPRCGPGPVRDLLTRRMEDFLGWPGLRAGVAGLRHLAG